MSFKNTALLILVPLILVGCSETVPGPATTGDGVGDFEGTVNPALESFVLQRLEVPNPTGTPIRVELIGRFVYFRDSERPTVLGEVFLAVKVRNADYRTLHAPGEIVLSKFSPNTVAPMRENPDWTACPGDSTPATDVTLDDDCLYGYDYSELLGGDGRLDPGESSEEKLWAFWDPEVVSFSFHATARFALEPDHPRIAGLFYSDENRNGQHDPDESPFGGGSVHITGPDLNRDVQVDGDGRYSVAVREPGLYTLWATPPPTFAPVEPTTTNPLGVVLIRGADGMVESFLHADFGWANALFPLVHPVQFIESRDQIPLDPYSLMQARLEGQVLYLNVSFSGCNGDHPFQLYMIGGPMMSSPPQALLLLAHDDRNEPCDAAFGRNLAYDLSPILERFGPMIVLQFEDWGGQIHTFEVHGPDAPSSGE